MRPIREAWAYETEDGKFKISGATGKPDVEITVMEPGYGIGTSEVPETRASVALDFNDLATIYHAVKAKMVDASQR